MEETRRVKAKVAAGLLKKKNVVAVGIGYKIRGGEKTDEVSIVVSVKRKISPELLRSRDLIPKKIDDVLTDVIQTGTIKALDNHAGRYRPAPGGVSIGHKFITAGTLGCLVRTPSGEVMILSNNHVLANSNDSYPGDEILQPGPYDGGGMNGDLIAELFIHIPIEFGETEADCKIALAFADVVNWLCETTGRCHRVWAYKSAAAVNRVDAALARPVNNGDVMQEILEIGFIKHLDPVAFPTVGDTVKKSGRTTGLSFGEVLQLDVIANVDYGEGKIATFEDQIMADAMSSGGDSGSLVLNEENQAVGLLFAGSDQVTIMNPIAFVLDALQVELI